MELLQRLTGRLKRAAVRVNPAPAVFVAEALELVLAKGYQIPDGLAAPYCALALNAIADEIEIKDHQALGLCLGRLGDPRIHDLRDPAAYVEVPPGSYPYQDDETFKLETPILLSRYPVTNDQYQAIIDDGGYANPEHWSKEGWAWRKEEGVEEPGLWRDRRWNTPNQPVVGVSFWVAEACCAWAGSRLPNEREREAAARGPDGCEYPWCGPWEDGICNSSETGLGMTSAVGLFPRERQALLGLEDLAGNVDEWCEPDESGEPDGPRVLRGETPPAWRAASWSWPIRRRPSP